MTPEELTKLRRELIDDPANVGYALTPADQQNNRRHQELADLFNRAARQVPSTNEVVPIHVLYSLFLPSEYVAVLSGAATQFGARQRALDHLLSLPEVNNDEMLLSSMSFIFGPTSQTVTVRMPQRLTKSVLRSAEIGIPQATVSDVSEALLRTPD